MTKDELWETIRELETALARVDGKYKMLRRRAHIHRGDISGEQAERLRALLRRSEIQMIYSVVQVILKEKFIGTGSGNLTELENAINAQAAKGWRLHTITTASGGSKGLGGGDRIQATLVFEKAA